MDESLSLGQFVDKVFDNIKEGTLQMAVGACNVGEVKVYRCGAIVRIDVKLKEG